MLVTLCLIWGMTWPMMKIALNEIPPLSMRTLTAAIGGVSLFVICLVQTPQPSHPHPARVGACVRRVVPQHLSLQSLYRVRTNPGRDLAGGDPHLHLADLDLGAGVAGPWRASQAGCRGFAVVLCAIGIAILVAPLATSGIPLGLVLAVGAGFSWAAGTVYLKWARIDADPMGAAAWQLAIGFVEILACLLIFDGGLDLHSADAGALAALAFVGVMGNAVAYAMWFDIVPMVPAATAALGILGIPVLGVASTVLIVGDRLTGPDIVGFALIFAASACVLLFPHGPKPRYVLSRCVSSVMRATIELPGSVSASMTVK